MHLGTGETSSANPSTSNFRRSGPITAYADMTLAGPFGGEWISSVGLENAIIAHPEVLEAAAIGVPDSKWGERPLACVVIKNGLSPDLASLRSHLASRVARWWIPERWAFIPEVPKTSVGKFDKKVLRAQYAAGQIEEIFERDDRGMSESAPAGSLNS